MSNVKAGLLFTQPGAQISDDLGRTWRSVTYRVNRVSNYLVYYGIQGENRSRWKEGLVTFERDIAEGRKVPTPE